MCDVRGTDGVIAPRDADENVLWHVAIVIATAAMTNRWAGPVASETIEAALARAYQNNPQLNAQRAVVRKTDEGVPQALSGYRPTINANASAGRLYTDAQLTTGGLTSSITAPFNTWSVGANATQNLFNAQTPNRTRAAESQVFAARETLRVMEQSVLLSAASVYMDVLRDEANLQLQRDNVRVLRQTLIVAQDNFRAGLVTSTDADQAQARLAFGEAALHAAESALLTTKANYRRIIGTIPDRLSPGAPVDRFLPHKLEAAVAQSLSQNPLLAVVFGHAHGRSPEVRQRKPGTKLDKRKGGRYAGRVRLAIVPDRSAESLCGFVECAVVPGTSLVATWSSFILPIQFGSQAFEFAIW